MFYERRCDMEKIYDASALCIVPLSDGLVFAYCQEIVDDQMTVAYKTVSFETGAITNVTSDFFSIAKFGTKYRSYLLQVQNPVTCKTLYLPNGNVLLCDDKGDAKIIKDDITTVWSGSFVHAGNPVSSMAVDGGALWCSYKDSGIVVKYNLRNMRDELRLGGGRNPVISSPKGIWCQDSVMRLCDCDAGKIYEIDLKNYSMKLYREFGEPVHQYAKIKQYEFVLLDSGIYLL